MNFKCIYCQCQEFSKTKLNQCKDLYLNTDLISTYVKCRYCSSLQQQSIPKSTNTLYSAYPIHKDKSAIYRSLQSLIARVGYLSIDQILRLVVEARNLSTTRVTVVDYGCGDGAYIKSLSSKKKVDCYGFEPNPDLASNLSNKLQTKIYSTSRHIISDLQDRADVVTLNHVIEHLKNPIKTLQVCHKILKRNGYLYIAFPNPASLEARLFQKTWHGLDAPRHIGFPSQKAIDILAKRCSFRVVNKQNFCSHTSLSGSISTTMTGKFKRPIFALSIPISIALSPIFNDSCITYLLQSI